MITFLYIRSQNILVFCNYCLEFDTSRRNADSPVMPMVSVYRLPHGQYGYPGYVIILPQDIAGFVTTLPRHANKLDIIIVRKEGNSPSQHHDFLVRRSVVLSALQFLIANNKYFSNITINNEALLQLPQDGDLPSIPVITFDSQDIMDTFTEPDAYNVEQDTYNTNFSSTFIPSNWLNKKISCTHYNNISLIHGSMA